MPSPRLALYDTASGRTEAVAQRLRAEFGVDVARCESGATVIDILMKNQPTPLLRACRARGLVCHPGYEMLVQQVPEYLAFFGYEALARQVQADASELRALLAPQ